MCYTYKNLPGHYNEIEMLCLYASVYKWVARIAAWLGQLLKYNISMALSTSVI